MTIRTRHRKALSGWLTAMAAPPGNRRRPQHRLTQCHACSIAVLDQVADEGKIQHAVEVTIEVVDGDELLKRDGRERSEEARLGTQRGMAPFAVAAIPGDLEVLIDGHLDCQRRRGTATPTRRCLPLTAGIRSGDTTQNALYRPPQRRRMRTHQVDVLYSNHVLTQRYLVSLDGVGRETSRHGRLTMWACHSMRVCRSRMAQPMGQLLPVAAPRGCAYQGSRSGRIAGHELVALRWGKRRSATSAHRALACWVSGPVSPS